MGRFGSRDSSIATSLPRTDPRSEAVASTDRCATSVLPRHVQTTRETGSRQGGPEPSSLSFKVWALPKFCVWHSLPCLSKPGGSTWPSFAGCGLDSPIRYATANTARRESTGQARASTPPAGAPGSAALRIFEFFRGVLEILGLDTWSTLAERLSGRDSAASRSGIANAPASASWGPSSQGESL